MITCRGGTGIECFFIYLLSTMAIREALFAHYFLWKSNFLVGVGLDGDFWSRGENFIVYKIIFLYFFHLARQIFTEGKEIYCLCSFQSIKKYFLVQRKLQMCYNPLPPVHLPGLGPTNKNTLKNYLNSFHIFRLLKLLTNISDCL
jgi:hypothetical protein